MVPGTVPEGEDLGDVRTRTFGAVSASVGALYDLGGGIGVGANLGRAYRTPDVTELFTRGAHLATYSVELNNPDLKAETGLGADLFLRITRERVKGEVAAFRNQLSNYIFPRNTGELDDETGHPVYQYAGADAVLAGVEGRAEWSVAPRVVLDGTLSYVHGAFSDTKDPLPFIPPLSGRLDVRYEAPNYFATVGSKLASRQARLGEFEEATDGYHVFDASLGYRWVALGRVHTLTLRGDNLGDAVYRDHLSRIKAIMPQAGRSVSLLYRVNF
jgi:iron complex outermembrane receptor protein